MISSRASILRQRIVSVRVIERDLSSKHGEVWFHWKPQGRAQPDKVFAIREDKKQRWKNRKILIPCCLPASIKDTVDVPIIHYWTLTGTLFFLLWVLVRNYSAKHLFAVVRCARVEPVPLTLFLLPLASSLLFVLPYTVDRPWGYFIHYTLSLLPASLTGSFSLFLVFFQFLFRWILSLEKVWRILCLSPDIWNC